MKIPDTKLHLEADDVLSFRDFTGWSFLGRESYDFSFKVIYASCFSQEKPDSEIFPRTMNGVIFVRCNLSNVKLPAGNSAIDCNQSRFQVQNDLNDWLIDSRNLPTLPVDHRLFTKSGLPVPDPAAIPAQRVVERVDLRVVAEAIKLAAERLEVR